MIGGPHQIKTTQDLFTTWKCKSHKLYPGYFTSIWSSALWQELDHHILSPLRLVHGPAITGCLFFGIFFVDERYISASKKKIHHVGKLEKHVRIIIASPFHGLSYFSNHWQSASSFRKIRLPIREMNSGKFSVATDPPSDPQGFSSIIPSPHFLAFAPSSCRPWECTCRQGRSTSYIGG